MTRYKKCFDCDFFENRCYEKLGLEEDVVISICNKYMCCTNPEATCRVHRTHNHSNYEPELYASSAGRNDGDHSPPFDVNAGPRHHSRQLKGFSPSPRQQGDAKDQRKGRGMNLKNACEVGLLE